MTNSLQPSRRWWRVSGTALCSFGLCVFLYAAAAALSGIWSAKSALALYALWGLVCLGSGWMRLKRGRPLFFFRAKALSLAARGLFALFCLCLAILFGMTVWGVFARPAYPVDAVTVLGARIYGNQPSLLLQRRIDAAADCLSKNPQAIAVACGGFTDGFSEAQVIRDGLAAQGIDPARVYLEDQSGDTRENLRNAAQILSQFPGIRRVAVVTSDYHLWRSAYLLRGQGYEPVCVGAPVKWYLRPIAHFQEMLSIVLELILP